MTLVAAVLEGLQAVATIIATGTGTYVAIAGLNAWRRETTGKRDIELCESVIEKFYEAGYKVEVLRSPFSYAFEGKSRAQEDGGSDEETDRRNMLFVPLERLTAQHEFWAGFFSLRFRMRALFGEDAEGAFNKVNWALQQFEAAAQTLYFALCSNRGGGLDDETRTRFQNMIWATTGSKPDPINEKMKDAISSMESLCLPIARSARSSKRVYKRLWPFRSRRCGAEKIL